MEFARENAFTSSRRPFHTLPIASNTLDDHTMASLPRVRWQDQKASFKIKSVLRAHLWPTRAEIPPQRRHQTNGSRKSIKPTRLIHHRELHVDLRRLLDNPMASMAGVTPLSWIDPSTTLGQYQESLTDNEGIDISRDDGLPNGLSEYPAFDTFSTAWRTSSRTTWITNPNFVLWTYPAMRRQKQNIKNLLRPIAPALLPSQVLENGKWRRKWRRRGKRKGHKQQAHLYFPIC